MLDFEEKIKLLFRHIELVDNKTRPLEQFFNKITAILEKSNLTIDDQEEIVEIICDMNDKIVEIALKCPYVAVNLETA